MCARPTKNARGGQLTPMLVLASATTVDEKRDPALALGLEPRILPLGTILRCPAPVFTDGRSRKDSDSPLE